MKRYGLLGEKLGHSFSPLIHGMLGDYDYRLYEVSREGLPAFLSSGELDGFNVTIPYKQAVIPHLAELSPAAQAIGSVNTVIRRANGSLLGDNTDAYGFACQLGDSAPFRGEKALILGSGGASKTVQWVLKQQGIHGVVISRQGEDNYGNLNRQRDAALIVNTTPVGMFPDLEGSPLDISGFLRLRLVLDLIYNPARTRLMLQADELGIENRGGLLMLAAQAVKAAELFGQLKADRPSPEAIARAIQKRTLNLALIGMPGSGKSSVARALGRLSGLPVFDTDEMLEAETGIQPGDYLAEKGEPAFRDLETELLKKACARSGAIIATGGGVVTRPENRDILRQNSQVVWLQRPLEALSIAGRPLSQARGLEALYQERAPKYQAFSEASYPNDDIEGCARAIMEDLL